MFKSGKFYIAAILTVISMVSGCQSQDRISLEEALEITATFQPSAIKRPPRTTGDVLAALDQYETAGDEWLKALQIVADASIDTSLPPDEQSRKFENRANSARQIGRANQEIAIFNPSRCTL